MVGISVNKAQVDSTVGAIAASVNEAMERVGRFKFWLDAQLDADLEGMGYSPADIATLRSAVNDLGELRNLYVGSASLQSNKDFRTFVRRIWGLGMDR